jgi:3-isopropylmalate/(R)-2-methylmalate dehydratase small subunit
MAVTIMSKQLVVQGSAFLLGDDVNTDLNCSNKYLPGQSVDDVAKNAFDQLAPGIASRIASLGGGILVAGKHFGINSSREQATQVLHKMNVRAVVAQSFGRQFFRNAINNGLPVFECDTTAILEGQALALDLSAGTLHCDGCLIQNVPPLPAEILVILSMGGLLPFLKKYPDWKFA